MHELAKAYHWSESDILRLERRRRARYLELLDRERDANLLGIPNTD